MKTVKAPKTAHTSNSKRGMGDFYGTGIKQKVGRVREDTLNGIGMGKKKAKKAPRSLA